MGTAERAVIAGATDGLGELMRAIISHSPIGVAVVDFDGVYRAVNPSYCALYGYAEHEFLGNVFTMVFPTEQRATVLRRHQQFLSQGGEFQGELDVRRRDGTMLRVNSESVRLHGADPRGLRLVYVVDITARREMEIELRASEEMYRTLFETVPQGVVYHDLSGRITAANPAAERILGLPLVQLRDRRHRDPRWKMVHEDGRDFALAKHPYRIALRTGQPVHSVVMGVIIPDLGTRWIVVNAIPLFRDGRLDKVYSCFEDATERVQRGLELSREASTDFLTGAANRRSVMDRLARERTRLASEPGQCCAVLAIDLDFFKAVNDGWGHAAGDAVLRHVTALMGTHIRGTDLLGRTGGEEFLIVLPDASLDAAAGLAERLRGAIEQTPARYEEDELRVTVSIGISRVRAGDASAHAVLDRADQALYEAKNAGRNRVCTLA